MNKNNYETNNINDKISLIIDTDYLFNLNDPDVQAMINGDTYLIDNLYKKAINNIKELSWVKFKHTVTGEIKSLDEWIDWYRTDMNNPKSIMIFLRYTVLTLI
jgi:hypothetical protein